MATTPSRMLPRLALLLSLGLASLHNGQHAQASMVEVDLLAYYTPDAAERYLGDAPTRIRHLLQVTNEAFLRSGVTLRVRLLAVEPIDQAPIRDAVATLKALTHGQHEPYTSVHAQREDLAADVVVLFGRYAHDGHCGLAWQGGRGSPGQLDEVDAAHAYAFVAIDCSVYTLAHELGHMLGLAHSRQESPQGGTLPHAAGYGVPRSFVTVMADPNHFAAPRLPYFSSPNLHACLGLSCGHDAADPLAGADAVAVLNLTGAQMATYRSPPRTGTAQQSTPPKATPLAVATVAQTQVQAVNKPAWVTPQATQTTAAAKQPVPVTTVAPKPITGPMAAQGPAILTPTAATPAIQAQTAKAKPPKLKPTKAAKVKTPKIKPTKAAKVKTPKIKPTKAAKVKTPKVKPAKAAKTKSQKAKAK